MENICIGCEFYMSWGCNRLVIPGGQGRHDRVAKDFMKDGKCNYRKEKTGKDNNFNGKKTNFENS